MMLFSTFFLHFGKIFFFINHKMFVLIKNKNKTDALMNRITVTLFWCGLAYVCLKVIVANGTDFVDKPRLRTPASLARRTQIPPFASDARVIAGDHTSPSIGIAHVHKKDIPKEPTTFTYTDGKIVRF